MTGAALALALAVLVLPASPRRRSAALMSPTTPRRRMPLAPCLGVACAGAATVLPLSAVLALAALLATLMIRRRLRSRGRNRVAEAATLQGALDVLVGELRVGAHPVAAIDVAARESEGPIARSLSAVAARALLGADVAAGLRGEAQRSLLPGHWERLAVCWQLAEAHGLAIATLMQAAHRDITERERFRGRVEAGLAGARATAAILAGLPVLGVLLGVAIGADPLGFLVSGGPGGWLLLLGSLFICCGLLWSDRITSRVLA